MGARLNHIGIVGTQISDLVRVFAVLGFTERTPDEPDTVQRVTASFMPATFEGPLYLELLEPIGNESPISNFLKKNGGGLHHLCFTVDDIEKINVKLKAEGYQCVSPPVDCLGYDRSFHRSADHPTRIAFFLTPAKILIELLEEG